jgi:hypothetical protein
MTIHKHKTAIIAWVNGSGLEYKNSYGVWWDYIPMDFSDVLDIRIKEEHVDTLKQAKLQKIAELKEIINRLEREL